MAYTKLEAHKDLESEKLEILEKRRELDSDLSKLQTMKVNKNDDINECYNCDK